MKVLMINGSPHREGNTFLALSEIAKTLEEEGIESEIVWIGTKAVQGCIACYKCMELGRCVFQDDLYNKLLEKGEECDALVVGSPVYYAGPNGSLCALMDRLMYSGGKNFAYKPAASVAVCRRGGASAAFDRINMAYGREPGDVLKDGEGMQTMRTLGRNMAWMLKKIHAGGNPDYPAKETPVRTNFIR